MGFFFINVNTQKLVLTQSFGESLKLRLLPKTIYSKMNFQRSTSWPLSWSSQKHLSNSALIYACKPWWSRDEKETDLWNLKATWRTFYSVYQPLKRIYIITVQSFKLYVKLPKFFKKKTTNQQKISLAMCFLKIEGL